MKGVNKTQAPRHFNPTVKPLCFGKNLEPSPVENAPTIHVFEFSFKLLDEGVGYWRLLNERPSQPFCSRSAWSPRWEVAIFTRVFAFRRQAQINGLVTEQMDHQIPVCAAHKNLAEQQRW